MTLGISLLAVMSAMYYIPFGMPGGFSWGYLGVIIVTMVIGVAANALIKHSYHKWHKVGVSTGLTGAQAARKMLDAHGLTDVAVQRVVGELSDHFDPRTNVVSLSAEVYDSPTVAATAIACHECGHAVQFAEAYTPMRMRSAIVPAVNIASNCWIFLFIAGLVLGMLGLVWVAIILFVAVIAFQLVTLPVEFNASARGLRFCADGFGLAGKEYTGAGNVLRAAAMTYVAAALSAVIQLLYLLSFTRNNNN
jgi:Zn-dependent membrane protease YugP